jgi:hypothetical protein
MEEIDLFEELDSLPQEVVDVVSNFEEDLENGKEPYSACADLVTNLEKIGYTCEYGLSGEPHGLRQIKQVEVAKKELRLEVAKKLLSKTNENISDMQYIIHGGFLLDNETFRMMLRNNEMIKERWDTLQNRKFKLERIIYKLA